MKTYAKFSLTALILSVVMIVAVSSVPRPARAAGPWYVAYAATFTVNSTIDAVDANPGDGICASAGVVCTLRAAIQEANALAGDDTILLPSGTYTLTIANPGGVTEDTGLTGDLDITSNLVISATGATRPIVDGNGSVLADRVFHILNASTVNLLGIDIRGGKVGSGICPPGCIDGAGILNSNGSNLMLSGSILSNNVGSSGGAIRNNGIMTVTDVSLSNNFAEDAWGGGGIFNVGTMAVTNSTINDNIGGSGIGGIYSRGTLNLNNSFVLNNTGTGIGNDGFLTMNQSVVSGNTAYGNCGGGITNGGVLTLTNSLVSNNTASSSGGGICTSGTAVVNGSTVSGNTTTLNGGGGIYVPPDGYLTVINSIISNNTAPQGSGGAIKNEYGTVTMNNSVAYGNTASSGGGIANFGFDATVTLNNSTISSNTANAGGGIISSAGSGTLILNNSTVSSNMIFATNNGGGNGGGIAASGPLSLTNSTVSGNVISVPAGAYCGINNCSGGGIAASALSLNNSTVSGNVISVSAGAFCDSNSCNGGGLFIYFLGTGSTYNTTISNNSVSVSPAAVCNLPACSGGGLFNNGATTLANTILAGNRASQTGLDCNGILGSLSSSGYNLLGNIAGCPFITSTGDVLNQSAVLGSLTGLPGYHPLLLGSPAVDAGNPAGCRDQFGKLFYFDQRSFVRVGRCDIGAYEYGATTFGSKSVAGEFQPGGLVTYTIVLDHLPNLDLGNVLVTDTLPIQVTYVPGSFSTTSGVGGVNGGTLTWSGTIISNTMIVIMVSAVISDTAPKAIVTNQAVVSGPGFTFIRTATFDTFPYHIYLPVIRR